jgi:putative cell wall-binding protein
MKNTVRNNLYKGCMAVAVAVSVTLLPLAVAAAGTKTPISFTRLGGADRYQTAASMAQKGWPGTSQNVVLSAGMDQNLIDALGAGPLAAKLNAPIIFTDGGENLIPLAKAELLRLKPQKAYITSGTGVIKTSVLNELTAMGITPVQLGGSDRYETSVNIAKELANQGADITRVFLTPGWVTPADALSVSSIAGVQEIPILCTAKDELPVAVKTYLDSIKAKVAKSYVIGGTGVVSDSVKGQLPGEVSRYAGQDRYETNVEVLKNFTADYRNKDIYVANGETLVDALAGVPLAAAAQAPVVLVNQQLAEKTREFVKLNLATNNMVALGGEAVVPSAEMNKLTSAVTYAADSAVEGSSDSANLLQVTDNILITGKNVTLQNVKADYSIYIKGDNVILSNLNVKGTVFVDPGNNGSATLKDVKAANIVILSGGTNSINLINTTADGLIVDSDSSNVHVVVTGTTTIGDTTVRTYAILDNQGGNLGEIVVTTVPGQTPVVELKGTFNQKITIDGEVTLKAAEGTVVNSVEIDTVNPDDLVTLEGNFKSVKVNSEGQLALGEDTVVTKMTTDAAVDITIPPSSNIRNLDFASGTTVSGGGTVNGEKTTSTPSEPPAGNGEGGGGGGGGGGGDTPSNAELLIEKLQDVHDALDDDGKTALRNAREALQDLPADSPDWNAVIKPLLTDKVIALYRDDEDAAKTALITFIKDFSNLYYSEDPDTLEDNLETFKDNNEDTFRTLFGDDFTLNQFYGFLAETQDVLSEDVNDLLDALLKGELDLDSNLKNKVISWTKDAMSEVISTSTYAVFDDKLSDIGWSTDMLVDAQKQLGAVVDPDNDAEKALIMAVIRAQLT